MSTWQDYLRGVQANHCTFAVLGIGEVLQRFGIENEPIVVAATVEWPNGLSIEVGSPDPHWKNGQWTGHAAIWIPGVQRFMDPTIYQANRPQAPTQISSGVLTFCPNGPEELVYSKGTPKDGTLVHYAPIPTPDDWLSGVDDRLFAGVRRAADRIETHLVETMQAPAQRSRVEAMTYPPLVADLERRGLRSSAVGVQGGLHGEER